MKSSSSLLNAPRAAYHQLRTLASGKKKMPEIHWRLRAELLGAAQALNTPITGLEDPVASLDGVQYLRAVGLFGDQRSLRWSFSAPCTQLSGVRLLVGTSGRANACALVIEVFSGADLLVSRTLDCRDLIDNDWLYVRWPCVEVPQAQPLSIVCSSPDGTATEHVALWQFGDIQGSGIPQPQWRTFFFADLVSAESGAGYGFFPWFSCISRTASGATVVGWRGKYYAQEYVPLYVPDAKAEVNVRIPSRPLDGIEVIFGTHGRKNTCAVDFELFTHLDSGKQSFWKGTISAETLEDTGCFRIPIPHALLRTLIEKWITIAISSPNASRENHVSLLGSKVPVDSELPWLERGPVCNQVDHNESVIERVAARTQALAFQASAFKESRPLSALCLYDASAPFGQVLLAQCEALFRSFRDLGNSLELVPVTQATAVDGKLQSADFVFCLENEYPAHFRTLITEARCRSIPVVGLCFSSLEQGVGAADKLMQGRAEWREACNAVLSLPLQFGLGEWLSKFRAQFVQTHLPKVSIVTVLYRKQREIPYFLQALSRQDYPGEVELVVVDDCSPDDSRAVLLKEMERCSFEGGKRPALKLVTMERNSGNCSARNRALKEVQGEIVIIVDCDCLLNRSFISAHVFSHIFHETQVVIGACNLESGTLPPLEALQSFECAPRRILREAQLQDDVALDSFVNCITRNFSIRRNLIPTPLFDEDFNYSTQPESGFGWEDVEMGYRLYSSGLKIFFTRDAFSVHVSHESSVEERTKPLRSIKNFWRLAQKHPEITSVARRWYSDTFEKLEAWSSNSGNPVSAEQELIRKKLSTHYPYKMHIRRERPLRIATYRWHCPHQYELYKLPHHFTLLTDLGTGFTSGWNFEERPFPRHAELKSLRDVDPAAFDVVLLHFDENMLALENCNDVLGTDWDLSFRRAMELFKDTPRVAVCHGTPQFYGQYGATHFGAPLGTVIESSRRRLVEYLKDVLVICNSYQAQHEWQFHKSQVIWQGFDPSEFLQTNYKGGVLSLGRSMEERPHYRGYQFYKDVSQRLDGSVRPQGLRFARPELFEFGTDDYARLKYRRYREAVRQFSIYFNPTLRSPMPRARGEAMMCGLVTASAANHDVERFIDNGVNGFYSNDPEELAEKISYLLRNGSELRRMGAESRQTAVDLFNHDRYLAAWQDVLCSLV